MHTLYKLFVPRPWLLALPLILVLSACGVNMTGNPKLVATQEILPTATPTRDLVVTGSLLQGTPDAEPIGAGVEMRLHVLNFHNELVESYTTTTGEGGAYTFEDVARSPSGSYILETNYGDVVQAIRAPVLDNLDGGNTATIDMSVFATSTDPLEVRMVAQSLLNYGPIEQFGIEVQLDMIFVNRGDHIVITDEKVEMDGEMVPVSAKIELPPGAFGIQMDQAPGVRYVVETIDGVPTIKDTRPIYPGEPSQIRALYYLPYDDGAVIEHAFGYPIMAGQVLVPNDTVQFSSDQFATDGEFAFRANGLRVSQLSPEEAAAIPANSTDPTLVRVFDTTALLGPEDHMVFTLNGQPTRTLEILSRTPSALGADGGDDSDNTLPVVLAVIGLATLGMAAAMWWRQRQAVLAPQAAIDTWQLPDPEMGREALLLAIAVLDDDYEADRLDDDTYHRRRDLLKERLIPLLSDDEQATAP